jgi:hypothetical protein
MSTYRPPEPRPVNRAALAWLMSIRGTRLSDAGRRLAYAIGTAVVAGRPADPLSLRYETGMRADGLRRALRELADAGLVEVEGAEISLVVTGDV